MHQAMTAAILDTAAAPLGTATEQAEHLWGLLAGAAGPAWVQYLVVGGLCYSLSYAAVGAFLRRKAGKGGGKRLPRRRAAKLAPSGRKRPPGLKPLLGAAATALLVRRPSHAGSLRL
jgi:hypothetical protein